MRLLSAAARWRFVAALGGLLRGWAVGWSMQRCGAKGSGARGHFAAFGTVAAAPSLGAWELFALVIRDSLALSLGGSWHPASAGASAVGGLVVPLLLGL